MNKIKRHSVLILGAEGMLGHTIYNYFKSRKSFTTYGTSRKKGLKDLYYLDCKTVESDFKKISDQLKKVDYVINAIGVLNTDRNVVNQIEVNSLFPHLLETLSERYKFKLIHISTDAVFADDCGEVNEQSTVGPSDIYGSSKLLGETYSENAITIRTSIIGLDPKEKKGLVEYALGTNKRTVSGYTDQNWSGCTTLQLAKLIDGMISDQVFERIKEKTSVVHFAPLSVKTKFELIKAIAFANNVKLRVIRKRGGKKINRILVTNFPEIVRMSADDDNLIRSLTDLREFCK